MAEPLSNALIANAISGADPTVLDAAEGFTGGVPSATGPAGGMGTGGGTSGTGAALAGGGLPQIPFMSDTFGGTAPLPGNAMGNIGPLGNLTPPAETGPLTGSPPSPYPTTITPGSDAAAASSSNAAAGSPATPDSSSLSPFAGGDVGSFVQWYNNLDPALATSLFTALQNAQGNVSAQAPAAGIPQLTGPVPMTVGT